MSGAAVESGRDPSPQSVLAALETLHAAATAEGRPYTVCETDPRGFTWLRRARGADEVEEVLVAEVGLLDRSRSSLEAMQREAPSLLVEREWRLDDTVPALFGRGPRRDSFGLREPRDFEEVARHLGAIHALDADLESGPSPVEIGKDLAERGKRLLRTDLVRSSDVQPVIDRLVAACTWLNLEASAVVQDRFGPGRIHAGDRGPRSLGALWYRGYAALELARLEIEVEARLHCSPGRDWHEAYASTARDPIDLRCLAFGRALVRFEQLEGSLAERSAAGGSSLPAELLSRIPAEIEAWR